jgi:hypothetical protein
MGAYIRVVTYAYKNLNKTFAKRRLLFHRAISVQSGFTSYHVTVYLVLKHLYRHLLCSHQGAADEHAGEDHQQAEDGGHGDGGQRHREHLRGLVAAAQVVYCCI